MGNAYGGKLQPALVTRITGKGMHPRNFTKTLYDKNGKLKDEGNIDKQIERSYFEAFVDPKQAKELECRLALVEAPGFVQDSIEFQDMEAANAPGRGVDDDGQDTD